MSLIDDIRALALRYSEELKIQIANRVEEMFLDIEYKAMTHPTRKPDEAFAILDEK